MDGKQCHFFFVTVSGFACLHVWERVFLCGPLMLQFSCLFWDDRHVPPCQVQCCLNSNNTINSLINLTAIMNKTIINPHKKSHFSIVLKCTTVKPTAHTTAEVINILVYEMARGIDTPLGLMAQACDLISFRDRGWRITSVTLPWATIWLILFASEQEVKRGWCVCV